MSGRSNGWMSRMHAVTLQLALRVHGPSTSRDPMAGYMIRYRDRDGRRWLNLIKDGSTLLSQPTGYQWGPYGFIYLHEKLREQLAAQDTKKKQRSSTKSR